MSSSSPSTACAGVTVSTPGKILAIGGYLVLKQAHSGLVIGTSARFTTRLRPLQAADAKRKRADSDIVETVASDGAVRVDSPQFANTNWYSVALDDAAQTLQLTPR